MYDGHVCFFCINIYLKNIKVVVNCAALLPKGAPRSHRKVTLTCVVEVCCLRHVKYSSMVVHKKKNGCIFLLYFSNIIFLDTDFLPHKSNVCYFCLPGKHSFSIQSTAGPPVLRTESSQMTMDHLQVSMTCSCQLFGLAARIASEM